MELETAIKVAYYGVFLVSLTVHEAMHATVAYVGGDRTAYVGGQVSLNPIPHIRREPFGMVILPVLGILSGTGAIGYATTPIDPLWALHHPRRAAFVSLAGPVGNLILVALALITGKILQLAQVLHVGEIWFFPADFAHEGPAYAAAQLLNLFLVLNVSLALLNLLPVPPFDGAGIIEGLFPRTIGPIFRRLRSSPSTAMLLLLVALYVTYNYLGEATRPAMKFAMTLIR